MANEATFTMVGNLTADPDLRYTPSGTARCAFTVASTPRRYDRQSGEWRDGDPLFMACTAWRDLAENAAESLSKGTRVVVTGRLRLSRWETPDGEKRSMVQLDVDDVGPSLRYARAQVRKLTRTTEPGTGAAERDLWTTPAPATSTGAAGAGPAGDLEPPF